MGAVLAVFHQDGLTGPVVRAVSLNQACPAKPFVATWNGVAVECARFGEDYSQGVITPVRGTASDCSGTPQLTPSRRAGVGSTPISAPRTRNCRLPGLQARGLSITELRAVVDAHTGRRTLGFLGEPTVNVLDLNLDLDHRYPYRA